MSEIYARESYDFRLDNPITTAADKLKDIEGNDTVKLAARTASSKLLRIAEDAESNTKTQEEILEELYQLYFSRSDVLRGSSVESTLRLLGDDYAISQGISYEVASKVFQSVEERYLDSRRTSTSGTQQESIISN